MGDVEDTDPAPFESANTFKQTFDSGLLQRCSGFIENQKASTNRKSPCNLDYLTLLNGEVPCEAVDIQIEAPVEHDLACARPHGTPIYDTVVIPCCAIEEDVLSDRKAGYHH